MTLSPSLKIDSDCGRPAKPHVAKPTLPNPRRALPLWVSSLSLSLTVCYYRYDTTPSSHHVDALHVPLHQLVDRA